MIWAFGRQSPDTSLMRFVSHRFFSPTHMLDIGSGEGANARELKQRGHRVKTNDVDLTTNPDIPGDIRELELSPHSFDLIYDINTLCHIERPPWGNIKSWLKPEGIFFSICPHYLSPTYIGDGKGFTQTYAEQGLRETLQPYFNQIKIECRSEPDFRDGQLQSWIVEARP